MRASGLNLQRGTHYTCRFGTLGDVDAIFEDAGSGAHTLTCTSPATPSPISEVVPLEVSLDNVSFTSAGLLFQYTATQPTVLIPTL